MFGQRASVQTVLRFSSETIDSPVEIVVMDEVSIDPLVEVRLEPPLEPGVHAIDLGALGARLEANQLYHWSVSIVRDETRTVLRLDQRLAPYKVAVLPLSKKETLVPVAREVFDLVAPRHQADYDETQAIGRRYRRQDEIGTPYCVTVDFDTLEDRAVTVRDRDTMTQDRVPMENLVAALEDRFTGLL